MKAKSTLIALAIGMLSMAATGAQAALPSTTITFDDVVVNAPFLQAALGTGYSGFSWNNFFAQDTSYSGYSQSGYVFANVSANNVALNGYGNAASFSAASAFTLNSFYLTAAWNDHLNVVVTGYSGTNVVRTTTLLPSATEHQLFTLNWSGIDKVMFEANGGSQHAGYTIAGNHFAIDNLTFSAAVPEPETYAMLLAGLGMIGFVGRRRRKWD